LTLSRVGCIVVIVVGPLLEFFSPSPAFLHVGPHRADSKLFVYFEGVHLVFGRFRRTPPMPDAEHGRFVSISPGLVCLAVEKWSTDMRFVSRRKRKSEHSRMEKEEQFNFNLNFRHD
jgi:hypothetical protein